MKILNELIIKRYFLHSIIPAETEDNITVILPYENGNLLTQDQIIRLVAEQMQLNEEGKMPADKIYGEEDLLDNDGDLIRYGVQIPIEALPKIPSNKLENEFYINEKAIFESDLENLDDEGYFEFRHNLESDNFLINLYDQEGISVYTDFKIVSRDTIKIYLAGLKFKEPNNNEVVYTYYRLVIMGFPNTDTSKNSKLGRL